MQIPLLLGFPSMRKQKTQACRCRAGVSCLLEEENEGLIELQLPAGLWVSRQECRLMTGPGQQVGVLALGGAALSEVWLTSACVNLVLRPQCGPAKPAAHKNQTASIVPSVSELRCLCFAKLAVRVAMTLEGRLAGLCNDKADAGNTRKPFVQGSRRAPPGCAWRESCTCLCT